MNPCDNDIHAEFPNKPWQGLTELPALDSVTPADESGPRPTKKSAVGSMPVPQQFQDLDAKAFQLLWDIACYPYSSVRTRIKRLGISGRLFEQAKHELTTKGSVIESSAGQTVYLIPNSDTFDAFNMPCPYRRAVSIEHSFYVALHAFLMKKDPRYRTVTPELAVGKTGQTADLGLLCHDGTKEAVEIILNTTNIITNAQKYAGTAFVRILFLCRDYQLRQAVKSSLHQSGLSTELLARLDFAQFSAILNRYRQLYRY